MNEIIKYINENEIADMAAKIVKSKKDINNVIHDIRMSRVEYQRKSQELQWAIGKLLKENGDK